MQAKTLYELFLNAQAALSDPSGAVWTESKLITWLLNGIKSISTYVPFTTSRSIACVALQNSYDLPADFKSMIQVEYPAGQNPPQYLKPLSSVSSAFANSTGCYNVIQSLPGNVSSLFLSQKPSTGETITIIYEAEHTTDIYADIEGLSRANPCTVTWTAHGLVTGDYVDVRGVAQEGWTVINAKYSITKVDANTFTIVFDSSAIGVAYMPSTDPGRLYSVTSLPIRLYELLMVYVTWCASRERLMLVSQDPDSSTLLLSQYAANADRIWRNYTEIANRMAKHSARSGPINSSWTMDLNDRIY